jgi:hypothetical protein
MIMDYSNDAETALILDTTEVKRCDVVWWCDFTTVD